MIMTWQPELDELAKREKLAKRMGGEDKVKRQHEAGRLTIRERVGLLLDQGSLHEIGTIAGQAVYDGNNDLIDLMPSNSFLGRGLINGRPVVVVGDDFTVRGGSADATIKEKNLMAEHMAQELHIPIVRLIEGSGGGGSVKTIETKGRANLPGGVGQSTRYDLVTDNLGTVPCVSLGLGPVAGLGAARMAASHYSVMVKNTSQLFVAGPPVVNALGYHLTRDELGGWQVQTRCGAVDEARIPNCRPSSPPSGFYPICLILFTACLNEEPSRMTRIAWTTGSEKRSPETSAGFTKCGLSSKRSSTAGPSSR